MSFGIERPKHRQLMAVTLLFFWLFGQMALSAHELLIEHESEYSCEWLCQTANQDDESTDTSIRSEIEASVDVFTSEYVSLSTQKLPYFQPRHRGPPQVFL